VAWGLGRSGIAVILFALAMSACGLGSGAAAPSPAVKPHVFVIVMENKTSSQALSGAYTASLAQRYALLTNYHAITHPSLPNYLALTSGSAWEITDDGYHLLPRGGIGDQLTAAGISWRAYMEGMSRDCLIDQGGYAVSADVTFVNRYADRDTVDPNIPTTPFGTVRPCLLYTSPSPRDLSTSRMPSSA